MALQPWNPRSDLYNGLTKASQAEPRLGTSYTIKPVEYGAARLLCADARVAIQ